MAPARWLASTRRALLFATLGIVLTAPAAHALRVVDYNILNYPGSSGPTRDPNYRTVLAPLDVDVLVTEEQNSQAGVDEFLNSVLNTMEPGEWAATPFINGNDTDAELYYKPAKVQFLGQWAFYPNPANQLRLVHVYRLKPVGYVDAAAEFRIYAMHLKASTGSESQRLAECTGVRDSMNAMPPGTRALICGDMNFYKVSSEPGYTKLTESEANNVGRVYDLLPAGEWHDNGLFAPYHTQSTCLTGCLYGEATGGLDDRFDMVLPTYSFVTGQGLAVIPGTCAAVGNDGQHLNKAITDAPTIPEGAAYASALIGTSDHMPVRLDLQLPAKLGTDASLAFGTVIVGATASQNLSITNPATPPADSLNYSFAPPADFTAPGGSFVLAAGDPAAIHAIGMTTATSGNKGGDLSIASDDPDNTIKLVGLAGTVLDHAQASLDSVVAVLEEALDFGNHLAGDFVDLPTRLHNRGYTALRARLSVNGGPITGSARFSIVGGFTSALLADVGKTYPIHFDDVGAPTDSTYEATLTFNSADEALPGAQPQPNLVVRLRARVLHGGTAVAGTEAPAFTRLYAPFPNPLSGSSSVRFDLSRRGEARLEVFDLSGRRVALLAQREFDPGRYTEHWNGRDASGATVGPGLYFVRLSGPGIGAQTARLAVVH